MATLGAVLYSSPNIPVIPEAEWLALVRSVAMGDRHALLELYARAQGAVYTFVARITGSEEIAEELTIDVFHNLRDQAARYDPARETALCWILNQARSRAISRVHDEISKVQQDPRAESPLVNSPSVPEAVDVLRPSANVQVRLCARIGLETDVVPVQEQEPEWQEVAPGIFCQLLATDTQRQRVSMLVRLLPGIMYPPHTHAGREQLHLLHGELWIEDRKLHAGDYHRAEAHTREQRVWSSTGCTCALHTSTLDTLH